MKTLGKNYKMEFCIRNMTVSSLSSFLPSDSLLAPILSHEAWRENVIYF